VTLHIGLWPDTENDDRHNLIAWVAFVVFNRRQYLPDHPVSVASDVNSETAFPFPFERVADVGRVLQGVEQSPWALDLPVSLRITLLKLPQVFACFGRQRNFVSLCRGKVLPARAFFLAVLRRSISAGSALISSVIRWPTARTSGRTPP
jgi:hypothetical protein